MGLCEHGVGSCGGVAGFLGSAQWYGLLRRLRLSVFDAVYDFCSGSLAKDWTKRLIPSDVVGELLLDTIFALFGKVPFFSYWPGCGGPAFLAFKFFC